ncbi:hypothetical protein EC957_008805, partial [Mortierella hygrophila]
MMIYSSISVVWRPISGGQFLVYNIDEVLSTLDLNKNQPTVLGVVSHNDYNKNIYGLGCATNYGIIRDFTEGMDVPSMVEVYLTDSRVQFKNKDKLSFATSIRAFVDGRQTPVSPTTDGSSDDPGTLTVEKVKARFAEARSIRRQRKSELEMARRASKRTQQPSYIGLGETGKSSCRRDQRQTQSEGSAKAPSLKLARPVGLMDKKQVIQALGWEHPPTMLRVGSLSKSVKSGLKDDVAVAKEAITCLQDAVHEAYEVKRRAQRIVGMYVERMAVGDLVLADREYLDLLCPRIVPEESNNGDNIAHINSDDDDDAKKDRQQQFLNGFLRFLYSEYSISATELVRSVSSQLTVELKKMCSNGTREIQKRYKSRKEIIALIWRRPTLKVKILELVTPVFPGCLALNDVTDIWLRDREPGFVIKSLLSDVAPVGLTSRQKGKVGYRAAVKLMTISEIKDNLLTIRQPAFDPRTYATKGYVLRGSIRTNGFSIQLAAFKLRELQAARFRRLPEDRLPPRLTTRVGGLDYYLTEMRNIVRTKEDVAQLWPNCAPDLIKILCLDLGQTCVVGAYASLPDSTCSNDTSKGKNHAASTAMDIPTTSTLAAVTTLTSPQPQVFYNLSVKQKAVSQPSFKFRRWTEEQKWIVPAGATESVEEIESNLPPLRGDDASIMDYVEEIQRAEDQLNESCNGNNMRYHHHNFDSSRAREEEFRTIANRLLSMIGGSVGAKRNESNMAVIGIGLGQFASRSGLTSLHGTFFAFFVCLARSLGYIVAGINEYYSSKKCPRCQAFVAQVTIWRLFCKACSMYLHRDEMAAHNMANVVRGHLLDQKRPDYLQPVDAQGRYPWKEDLSSSADGAGSGKSTSPNTDAEPKSSQPRQSRKRKAIDDTQPPTSPTRLSKRKA